MRILAAIRTFVVSYIVPGWGFWIVGNRKLAVATVIVLVGFVLIFSWSRLVLNPVAYTVFVCFVVALVFLAALYSAVLDFKRDRETSPPRNWRSAFIFALISGVTFYLVMSDRPTNLGYDVFRMPASSMAPTLVQGDYILVNTWHYSDSEVRVGEVIVFELPNSGGVKYIKRVVGLPGDTLSFDDNILTRNGTPVDEPYAYYSNGSTRPASAFQDLLVPDGEYFVLGDNRNNSRDSRFIGTIPKSNLIGRTVHLWYSKDQELGIQWQRFPTVID